MKILRLDEQLSPPHFQAHERPSETRLKIVVAAIFKNEFPYILEWVAYHRVLGIDHFFIADNDSSDGSTQLLAILHAAGIITHIPFPSSSNRPPQLPAYSEIMRLYKNDADWFGFIDADEFLLPTDGSRSIRPFIANMSILPGIGAIVVNWATYGSSGTHEATNELVIERFERRAEKSWPVNHHLKSIVRSKAWKGTAQNPHIFNLRDGYKTVHPNGEQLIHRQKGGPGLSDRLIWDHVRLNHYIVKSKSEFFDRKRARGRATTNQIRSERFFLTHDRNDVLEPAPAWLVEATKLEINRLKLCLEKTRLQQRGKFGLNRLFRTASARLLP